MNKPRQNTGKSKLVSGLANRMSVKELRERLTEVTNSDAVIYQWWFRKEAASVALKAIGEDIDNVKILRDRIDGTEYLALYAGKGKSCRQRFDWHIRQRHDERTVRHGFLSTVRHTICGLLGVNAVGNEAIVNAFIDRNCILDWTCYPGISPTDLGALEKERIQSGYFPLNLQGNPKVSKEIKRALRERRRAARHGRFPERQAIMDGTWTQKDLNALVAAGKKGGVVKVDFKGYEDEGQLEAAGTKSKEVKPATVKKIPPHK